MKIFIISTTNNLKIFNDKLGSEFPNLGITGSNSLIHGIETVSTRNIEEEYDAVLIINQKLEEEDLVSGNKITKKINESAKFALKGVPIYIFVNTENKRLSSYIKSTLKGENLLIFPYKNLTVETVKDCIRESVTLFKSVKTNKEEIRGLVKESLDGNNSSKKDNSAVRDFFNETLEATRTMTVGAILEDVLNSNEISKQNYTVKSVNEIVDNIKNQVYQSEPISSLTEKPVVSVLDNDILGNILDEENINELISETDTRVNELNEQSIMVDLAIERVKDSDRPNKVEEVLTLYGFKKEISTEIGSRRAVVTLDIISKLQEIIINKSSRNLESIYNLMDEIKAGNMVFENMEQTEALKKIKGEVKSKIEEDLLTQNFTKNKISELFDKTKGNLLNSTKVDKELIDYANSENTVIPDELTKTELTQVRALNQSMENVISLFNKYDGEHLKLLKSFDTLETVNEGIIESQDKTIDILMSQKVSKIVKVDNELKSKAIFFFGLKGTGKAFTSYNVAKASANLYRTLLLDLTESGTLDYYLKSGADKKVINDLGILNDLGNAKDIVSKTESEDNLTILTGNLSDSFDANILLQNLNYLSNIFETLIIVMPENLESYKELLENCTKKVLISEPEPEVLNKFKDYVDYVEEHTKASLVDHFILNKMSKRVPLTPEEICTVCGVKKDKYKINEIPRFENAIVSKFYGIALYSNNELAKSTFDNLFKKLK